MVVDGVIDISRDRAVFATFTVIRVSTMTVTTAVRGHDDSS